MDGTVENKEMAASINGTAEKKKMAAPPAFEDVLDKLGMPGRFQIIQLTLGILSMAIQANMPLAFVFLGYEPLHTCNKVNETKFLSGHGFADALNASIKYESCDIVIKSYANGSEHDVIKLSCPDGRNFSKAKHTTWLSEWDLVCDSKGVAELSFTCYNAGLVLGGLFWSAVADRFGRKPVVTFCGLMCVFWEALIIVAPNIYIVQGFRFVSGVFRQGLCEAYFVLGLEFLATRHRDLYGVIICYKWVFDLLFLGFTAYLFQDYNWKYFQAIVPISGVWILLYPFFLEESPRWLTAKKRYDDALKILKRASKQNGKDFAEVKEIYNGYVSSQQLSNETAFKYSVKTSDEHEHVPLTKIKQSKSGNESVTILTLFSTRKLAVLTLSSWFIWFANNMTYYGLYIVSSTLVGDRFLNYTFVALVEIPTIAIMLAMMRRMKRLFVNKIFLTLASFSLLSYSLLNTFGGDGPGMHAANVIAFVFGKMCITASYYVLFILTPEIYPTSLRTTATASCNSISRIGAMLVPFMRPLITVVKWGPGLIFTVICFIALGLMTVLPETKDRGLVDTVEQFKNTLSKKPVREMKEENPDGKSPL